MVKTVWYRAFTEPLQKFCLSSPFAQVIIIIVIIIFVSPQSLTASGGGDGEAGAVRVG